MDALKTSTSSTTPLTPSPYRYHIEGAPLPVTDNIGRFSIEANGGESRVVWESSFDPLDPAMTAQLAEMWEPYHPITLANLKRLI